MIPTSALETEAGISGRLQNEAGNSHFENTNCHEFENSQFPKEFRRCQSLLCDRKVLF